MVLFSFAQMEVVPGQPRVNAATMLTAIAKAKQAQAQVIIFPELALTGNLNGSVWEDEAFLEDCVYWGQQITAASQDIVVIYGNVWRWRGMLFNACFVAQNGILVEDSEDPFPCRLNASLGGDGAYDLEETHFSSIWQAAEELKLPVERLLRPVTLTLNGEKLALACRSGSDLFDPSSLPFVAATKKHHVDLVVHIGATPYWSSKPKQYRENILALLEEIQAPMVDVVAIGIQNTGSTVYVLDGGSAYYNKEGQVLAAAPRFQEDLVFFPFEKEHENTEVPPQTIAEPSKISLLYDALVYAINRFANQCAIPRVVIGLSGGIDSCVTACLYRDALGADNVYGVNMPGPYSSQTTQDIAKELATNLGIRYQVVPIIASINLTKEQLTQNFPDLPVSDSVWENIQARDRSSRILAAIAAACGGAFTCNGNKAEATVGYATMYGDATGFFAAFGDLWKYQVYDLAAEANRRCPGVIPEKAFNIPPSAELSSKQAVEQGKGDPLYYPYHDYLLRAFVEWNVNPEQILAWYQEGTLAKNLGCKEEALQIACPDAAKLVADTEYWWRQFMGMGVAKRLQSPPILALSYHSFAMPRHESQNGVYFTQRYQERKTALLAQQK